MEEIILNELSAIDNFYGESNNESIFDEHKDIEEIPQKPLPKTSGIQLKLPEVEEIEEPIEQIPSIPNNQDIDYEKLMAMLEEKRKQESQSKNKEIVKKKEETLKKYTKPSLFECTEEESESWFSSFNLKDIGIGLLVGGIFGSALISKKSTEQYYGF